MKTIFNSMATDPEFAFGKKGKCTIPAPLILKPKGESELKRCVGGLWFDMNCDGMNAEIQTQFYTHKRTNEYPVECIKSMADCLWSAMRSAAAKAKEHGVEVVADDLVPLSKMAIKKATDACWISGCNPTFSAETGMLSNVLPDYKEQLIAHGIPMGGHIHFIPSNYSFRHKQTGNISKDIEAASDFVKFMTGVALLPMMLIGYTPKRKKRLQMLGIGNFRLPGHGGIEMKDFSGFSLKSLPLFLLQWGFCRAGYSAYYDKETRDAILPLIEWNTVKTAIMDGDTKKMRAIFDSVKKVMQGKKYDGVIDQYLGTSPYALEIHKYNIDDGKKKWTNPYVSTYEYIGYASRNNQAYAGNPGRHLLFDFLLDNPQFLYSDDVVEGWRLGADPSNQDKGLASIYSIQEGVPPKYVKFADEKCASAMMEYIK